MTRLKLPVDLKTDQITKIKKILKAFKIGCKEITLKAGRYFDTYDITLADGTRSSNVDKALIDIGIALKAYSCPRGYPVFNKGVYRIEVQKLELRAIDFQQAYCSINNMYAPIALGVNTDGSSFSIDLQRLPNLLIGGVPGSGKSVLLHSIIFSLLKIKSKVYLIDPKMVEFNIYEDFKNIERIEDNLEGAYNVIKDVDLIMKKRFQLLKAGKVRSVQDYNKKVRDANKMHPVVIIIDEWADIILQDKNIQEPLCRIAQKGRAAGISVILATQRPSSKVINGLIKASFSGRIALKVVSNIDSRVILDQVGAEKINSVGGGLYLDQTMNEAKIFRAPYIQNIDLELQKLRAVKKNPFWPIFS